MITQRETAELISWYNAAGVAMMYPKHYDRIRYAHKYFCLEHPATPSKAVYETLVDLFPRAYSGFSDGCYA